MHKKLIVAAVLLALLPAVFAQPAPKVTCDRACLENYIDRYLDAMLAQKVDPQLFAKTRRFTENGVELPLGGEGLLRILVVRYSYLQTFFIIMAEI